jgi:hypothetical protein
MEDENENEFWEKAKVVRSFFGAKDKDKKVARKRKKERWLTLGYIGISEYSLVDFI